MSARKLSDIQSIKGSEGTTIRQIFHPHNTLDGIRYSIAHFTLSPGKKSALHKMKTSEIYYILEGSGILHVDDEPYELKKDDSIYVAPMSKQYLENKGSQDLKFLCIVDPAWSTKDEIILK